MPSGGGEGKQEDWVLGRPAAGGGVGGVVSNHLPAAATSQSLSRDSGFGSWELVELTLKLKELQF